MTGVKVNWLTDANIVNSRMTSDWLLCQNGIYNVVYFHEYCKKLSLVTNDLAKKRMIYAPLVRSTKLYFILFFYFLHLDKCIISSLTSVTHPLPSPSLSLRTCFYTHEWNRKWHFPASFVTHQSLLVCVMERKPSERWGSLNWSGEQGPNKGTSLDLTGTSILVLMHLLKSHFPCKDRQ